MSHDGPALAGTQIAIVQSKPRKGDVVTNLATLRAAFEQLAAAGAPHIIVLPEAALTGYFLEGAVYELAQPAAALAQTLHETWLAATGPVDACVDIVCGFYENDGGAFYNSALYVRVGGATPVIAHVHRKMFLPTYGVFDEARFVSRGRRVGTFASAFGPASILICEDAWHSIVPTIAALKGARLLFVPSASPGRGLRAGGELESVLFWRSLLRAVASEHGVYLIYAGLTGFEGGKGMAGSSCIIGPNGCVIVEAPALEACVLRATLDPAEVELARATLPLLGDLASVLPDLWFDAEIPFARPGAFT